MPKKECNWTPRQWILFSLLMAILVGLALLIGLGAGIVHPYRMTLVYEEAQCSPTNVTSYGQRTCSCGGGGKNQGSCTSEYPCVEIIVNIYPPNTPVIIGSRLYIEYTADYENQLCAVWPCSGNRDVNTRDVSLFVQTYGNINSNDTYPCLYNPNNPKEVILQRPTDLAVIMCMLWPSLLIVVCAGVMLVLWLTKKSQISTQKS